MILTRDNLLRFVREKKYVTPSSVAEPFETSTMIASAALGELTKDKILSVTHFKLGSSPYYFDPKQKDALVEIANKHFSKADHEIFLKLQTQQIINDKSLSVQERLAIGRIKDFAIPLNITYGGSELNFWVWYLRNIDETRNQILDALSSQDKNYEQKQQKNDEIKSQVQDEVKKTQTPKSNVEQKQQNQNYNDNNTQKRNSSYSSYSSQSSLSTNEKTNLNNNSNSHNTTQNNSSRSNIQKENNDIPVEHISYSKNQEETFIEKYLDENYLNIENKQKLENGISYTCVLKINKIEFLIDCFYFYKKPNEGDIIKFYTSSMRPKIAFIINCPKKLFKLAQSCDNFEVVNI